MPYKLNWLLQNTEPGSIVLQSWLTQNEISPSLANKYVKSNWLKKHRAGVYSRVGREPGWVDAIYCVQNQLKLPIYLSGLSSLNYQGFAHYLPFSSQNIWLTLPSKNKIPLWFADFPNANWVFLSSEKFNRNSESWYRNIEINNKAIIVSSAELAIYEVMHAIPKYISFEFASELFQGMVNLNPKKINEILTASKEIQTNRLFLFFKDYYQHAWANRIDTSNIELGSGKRQIVKGGKLNSKYNITIPLNFEREDV